MWLGELKSDSTSSRQFPKDKSTKFMESGWKMGINRINGNLENSIAVMASNHTKVMKYELPAGWVAWQDRMKLNFEHLFDKAGKLHDLKCHK